MGQNPAIPVAHAETPVHRGDGALIGTRSASSPSGRDAGITPLTANVGMRYGLRDGRGYDYPTDKRYDDLWRRAVTKPDPLGLTLPSTQATTSTGGAAGDGAAGGVAGDAAPAPLPLAPLVYAGPDARVYANPAAVPRAFVVGARDASPTTSWAR